MSKADLIDRQSIQLTSTNSFNYLLKWNLGSIKLGQHHARVLPSEMLINTVSAAVGARRAVWV